VTASTKHTGIDLRVVIVIGIALLLGLIGAAAWAVTTNNDLQATRATLASTSGDLDTTKVDLASTTSTLDSTTKDLASARKGIKDDQAKIKTLNFQIDRKGDCIEAQSANLAEMRRILDLERQNFARTGSASAWGKAYAADRKAINLAIDDLYKAYQSAAAGKLGTANSWISRSNAQIRVYNGELKNQQKQIDAINTATDSINRADDAFQKTLDATISTCGG
jgi:peptidoglycan hydrolase CwlO-like protein